MTISHPCPKCGKPMDEQPKFKGLWICPDGKHPINTSPPFRFKCQGMELDENGAKEFLAELDTQYARRTAESN